MDQGPRPRGLHKKTIAQRPIVRVADHRLQCCSACWRWAAVAIGRCAFGGSCQLSAVSRQLGRFPSGRGEIPRPIKD